MAVKLSTGAVNKVLGTGSLKSVFTACFLDVYSGPRPASADAAATGTKLATIYSDNGDVGVGLGWGTAADGELPKASGETWSGPVLAAGTAGWFRIREAGDAGTGASTTAARIDGSVAAVGGDLTLGVLTLAAGAPFVINSFSVVLPKE